jgi:hypothetical protein
VPAVLNWRFQQFRIELNQMVEAERTIFEPKQVPGPRNRTARRQVLSLTRPLKE